ncbi:MAG: hypothetical protein ACLSE6_05710 [Alphaproteobacteria bacterium]
MKFRSRRWFIHSGEKVAEDNQFYAKRRAARKAAAAGEETPQG